MELHALTFCSLASSIVRVGGVAHIINNLLSVISLVLYLVSFLFSRIPADDDSEWNLHRPVLWLYNYLIFWVDMKTGNCSRYC